MEQGEEFLEVNPFVSGQKFLTFSVLPLPFSLSAVQSFFLFSSFHSLAVFLQPVEREPLIYHLDSVSHPSKDHGDLPDEFFEVTVDDVRKRFAQLKSERWEKEVNGCG